LPRGLPGPTEVIPRRVQLQREVSDAVDRVEEKAASPRRPFFLGEDRLSEQYIDGMTRCVIVYHIVSHHITPYSII